MQANALAAGMSDADRFLRQPNSPLRQQKADINRYRNERHAPGQGLLGAHLHTSSHNKVALQTAQQCKDAVR